MPATEERNSPWVRRAVVPFGCRVCFRAPLIELYQGGPDCGLGLKQNMTQKPHEAHRAQPVTTEEETYINQTNRAMTQEQGLAHKQVETDKQFVS